MAGSYSSAFSSAYDVGAGGGGSSIVVLVMQQMANILDIVKKGSTDRSVTIKIIDSTTGLPETAVEHNTSGIDLWYRREGAAKTSITEAALSALTDAHSDGGIEHIGDGEYRLDLPDAAFATSANYVDVGGTITGMIVLGGRVRLVDFDPEVVAVGALQPTTAGRTLDVTATGAAGIDWSNVENQSTSVNLSATTTNLVNTATALTNAVASVTGAVGSVTGNVGGNVTGSVGSVVGAVGSVTGNVGGNVTGSVGSVASGGITRASLAADTGLQTIRSNTAQSGSTSSITLDASASSVNNFYNGMKCRITGGTGVGQESLLYSYNGTTKAAAVAPVWRTAPDNTSTFAITGTGAADFQLLTGVESYMGGVADFFQQFSDNGTVTGFSSHSAADVWAAVTRTLTAIDEDSTTLDLDATIRAAMGLASANLDTQLADIPTVSEFNARTLVAADYATNTDLDALITTVGVAGAGLTALATQASVNLIAADLPTRITKNVALNNYMFKMVDATDHVTAEAGLTITATRSLDGAAFASCANSASEVSGGWYKINLATTDLNGDVVVLKFTATGADTAEFVILTQPT